MQGFTTLWGTVRLKGGSPLSGVLMLGAHYYMVIVCCCIEILHQSSLKLRSPNHQCYRFTKHFSKRLSFSVVSVGDVLKVSSALIVKALSQCHSAGWLIKYGRGHIPNRFFSLLYGRVHAHKSFVLPGIHLCISLVPDATSPPTNAVTNLIFCLNTCL